MYRVDVRSFESIMTCIVSELLPATRLSIMVARMCMYTITLMNRMGSADFLRTGEVIIIISSRLLLPMIPSFRMLMPTSSSLLQILIIAVTRLLSTDLLVTTAKLYLTKTSTLMNMVGTWLISIGWIIIIIIIIIVIIVMNIIIIKLIHI